MTGASRLLYLSCAIFSEVIATSALKAANGFTRLWPSLMVVAGYGVAFLFLSLTLRTLPVGIAYAVWSGLGTALIALAGISLIVSGVVVMNVFSRSIAH